jgi:Ubiquitin carboxyl-terminal hydrolase
MWPTEAENDFLRIKSNSKAPFPLPIELSAFLEKEAERSVTSELYGTKKTE